MFLQLSSKKNKIYLWKLRPGQKAEANTTPVMEDAWCKGAMVYKKLKSMPDKTTTDLHVFSIHKIPCEDLVYTVHNTTCILSGRAGVPEIYFKDP